MHIPSNCHPSSPKQRPPLPNPYPIISQLTYTAEYSTLLDTHLRTQPTDIAYLTTAYAPHAMPLAHFFQQTAAPSPVASRSRKAQGHITEDMAAAWLQQQGLKLLGRNYKTPGRGGGEIDIVMQAPDGTVVFVEVRQRSHTQHGGAAASVGTVKQRRIALAAQHWLVQHGGRQQPPCRFDVITCQGDPRTSQAQWQWLQAAFDLS